MSIKSEQTLLPTRFGAKSLSDTIAVFFDMDHPTRGNDDPNMNGAPHDAEQNAVSWLLQSLRDWFPMSQPLNPLFSPTMNRINLNMQAQREVFGINTATHFVGEEYLIQSKLKTNNTQAAWSIGQLALV